MSQTIRIKRGQKSSIPTLLEGEFGYTTDTVEVFIGDGSSNHKLLSEEDIVTSISDPGSDSVVPSEQAVREALYTDSDVDSYLSGENGIDYSSGVISLDASLGDLNDVDTSNETDGYVLTYNSSTLNWEAKESTATSTTVATITGDYSANSNEIIYVNDSTSSLTITFPSSPESGDVIKVIDSGRSFRFNHVTIDGNGNTVDEFSSLNLYQDDSENTFRYDNETGNWVLTVSVRNHAEGLPYQSHLTLSGRDLIIKSGYGAIVPDRYEVEDDSELIVEDGGVFTVS